jgi:hypothetical protein
MRERKDGRNDKKTRERKDRGRRKINAVYKPLQIGSVFSFCSITKNNEVYVGI